MTIDVRSFWALILCTLSCMFMISFTIYKLYEIQTNSYKYIKKIILLNAERGISIHSKNVIIPNPVETKDMKSTAYNPKNDIIAQMSGKVVDVFDS